MTALALFNDLLSSLSRVAPLSVELWDLKGRLTSVESGRPEENVSKEAEELSRRVILEGAFRSVRLGAGRTLFGAPVRTGGEVAGALLSHHRESQGDDEGRDAALNENMEVFLTHLADFMKEHLAAQQEAQKMAEELTRSFEDLYLYASISTQVKTLHFSNLMLRDMIRDLLDTMRSDLAFALFPDREEYYAVNFTRDFAQRVEDPEAFLRILVEKIPAGATSGGETYFIVNDSRGEPTYGPLHPDPYRFLAVRIGHGRNFYGWLGLFSFNLKEIFRRGELKLLSSIAEQLAIVISNADLYRDLENFVINVVKSLVSTIEAKDTYTKGHSDRVYHYSLVLAEALDLDDEQMDNLSWAAILHDIGKIGIPESILNKPARLSDQEYDIVKQHPGQGTRILKPLKQLLRSLPGILHHHERYDGAGYPDGLKGEDIPLMARIISVADTFDAITSVRAYRSDKTPEEALAIMEEVAGTQLDPRLVKVFKDLYDQGAIEQIIA
ncbi:MAG: HD-GYP domain-containing protein [Deltaproteobacteria bacterium]|nr:HD-GYP domain-containing protein [Deltaproteobacteria bacterium]